MSFPPVASLGYRTGFNFILSRRTVYPELFAVVGARTPDYAGQFLRGLDAGHSVGERVQDTFKSHAHGQPAHTHSWNGQLASTALTGTAAGQQYVDALTGIDGNGRCYGIDCSQSFHIRYVSGVSGDISVSYDTRTQMAWASESVKKASSSTVTGRLNSGTVNGTVSSGGGDDTYATGDAETAPRHVYVRYLIRARP